MCVYGSVLAQLLALRFFKTHGFCIMLLLLLLYMLEMHGASVVGPAYAVLFLPNVLIAGCPSRFS
jgi:hypothetical protein